MRVPEDGVRLFNDSLDRCIANPDFMNVFYDRFIGATPQVATLFAATPMARQKRLLKASLLTAMLAADSNKPALEQLRRLAGRHEELHIPPRLYDLWLECLVATARECSEPFDEETEAAWRAVLGIALDVVRGETGSPAGEGPFFPGSTG